MKNTFSYIKECLLSLYKKMYNEKYTFMYNKNVYCNYISSYIITNKYCHYTSSYIIRNTFSCIIKMFIVIIHSLNDNKHLLV